MREQMFFVVITFSSGELKELAAQCSPGDNTSLDILNLLHRISSNHRVHFQWVPSHVGIDGNKKAYFLARTTAEEEEPQGSQLESMFTEPCIQSESNLLALSQAKNSKTLHPDEEHKPRLPDSIARPITNMPLSRMENTTFVKPSIIDFHDMGLRTVLTVRTPKEQCLFNAYSFFDIAESLTKEELR
ncbi:hypothetical protein TNCV_4465601 [Trichonephila clavipes]|nr:hypothetical protein TNCV_4465601 [Trichonephila clavipes]